MGTTRELYGVILAGGSGTRLWPWSRKSRPKQFLRIKGERSLLEEAYLRLQPSVPPARTLVVTSVALRDKVRNLLAAIPEKNIVGEPTGRGTAAAIGLAAIIINRTNPRAVMAVLTADHLLWPIHAFTQAINKAASIAEGGRVMVTFGIKPWAPSPVYGYIHRGHLVSEDKGIKVYNVEAFKEKPSLETARDFMETGEYYWNSGMFVWRVDTLLSAIEETMPELGRELASIRDALDTPQESTTLLEAYRRLPIVSIDYGVMEKVKNVNVIEAQFHWVDIGNWHAIEAISSKDTKGNTIIGGHCGVDTHRCLIASEGNHLVATVGLKDLIVIHTPDVTLVCPKEKAGTLQALLDELHKNGYEHLT